jgi:hypothetical protein
VVAATLMPNAKRRFAGFPATVPGLFMEAVSFEREAGVHAIQVRARGKAEERQVDGRIVLVSESNARSLWESAGTRKVGGYRKGVEDERLARSLFQPRIRLEKGIKPCSQTEPLLFTIRRVRC